MREKLINNILAITILTLIIAIIMVKAFTFLVDKINQERCYNLPLNDFYKDKSCMKYTQIWEELLGE